MKKLRETNFIRFRPCFRFSGSLFRKSPNNFHIPGPTGSFTLRRTACRGRRGWGDILIFWLTIFTQIIN
ncbi:hypothetical protein C7S16_2513 [Burkholderia thailandensis]|uniref:Uncharacterized protein n=1 Tax=Burkholderia thailandensis TaxID=57975 RepID=A0AAW9CZI6_BURTH|nr:hypothetical protein [Burkholderia thailandensis]